MRQCGVSSETIDYSLGITREVLQRDKPVHEVVGFSLVRLQTGSTLNSARPLSQILMDVELVVRLFVIHSPFRLELSLYILTLTEHFK